MSWKRSSKDVDAGETPQPEEQGGAEVTPPEGIRNTGTPPGPTADAPVPPQELEKETPPPADEGAPFPADEPADEEDA